MPARLRPADPQAVAEALAREEWAPGDLKLLSRHFLALLGDRAPGRSVEVRVPPYAAAQVIEGIRHTRGTPPAVVETDPRTWIALATGALDWSTAVDQGRVRPPPAAGARAAPRAPGRPAAPPPGQGPRLRGAHRPGAVPPARRGDAVIVSLPTE